MRCAACHATDHANRVGPGLEGIIGRKAGTVPGFRYSDAMKKSDIVWDAKTLDAYLESPQKVALGNRMPRRAEKPDGPDGPRCLSCCVEVAAREASARRHPFAR